MSGHAGTSSVLVVALAAAVAAIVLVVSGFAPPAAHAGASCANADAGVGEASQRALRRAVTCLIAERREAADRRKLRSNSDLKQIAQRHAGKMVKTNCFKHQCPGEATLPVRLQRSGYLDDVSRFGFAESTGCAETPRAMVKGWMGSDFHRQNLLGRRFRDIGIGVAPGSPTQPPQGRCQPEKNFLTFTAIFGWRRR